VSLADVVAIIMFLGVVLYAVFGGADFGTGFWDLTAGGAERGGPLRALIDHVIGPVWEANHVWLIFVLVYLWTGFPTAFAAIASTLWIPLVLAGLGIVLRGGAFVFRKLSSTVSEARLYGVFFASSSIVTPFFFGTIAGAVASGRVPLEGTGDLWRSWTGPTSIVGGVLAVLVCAFLAAVFLTHEAERQDDSELFEACWKRALLAGVLTGIAALAGILPLRSDAPELFDRLTGEALPIIVSSAVAGLATIWLLWKHQAARARLTAVAAVAAIVVGWGVAQYPWLLVDHARIEDVAGNQATLVGLVIVFGLAAVSVVPALAYLYWLTQQPAWAPGSEPEVESAES
jgi:cytochrome bd ubiquinol oxidase subunit II